MLDACLHILVCVCVCVMPHTHVTQCDGDSAASQLFPVAQHSLTRCEEKRSTSRIWRDKSLIRANKISQCFWWRRCGAELEVGPVDSLWNEMLWLDDYWLLSSSASWFLFCFSASGPLSPNNLSFHWDQKRNTERGPDGTDTSHGWIQIPGSWITAEIPAVHLLWVQSLMADMRAHLHRPMKWRNTICWRYNWLFSQHKIYLIKHEDWRSTIRKF